MRGAWVRCLNGLVAEGGGSCGLYILSSVPITPYQLRRPVRGQKGNVRRMRRTERRFFSSFRYFFASSWSLALGGTAPNHLPSRGSDAGRALAAVWGACKRCGTVCAPGESPAADYSAGSMESGAWGTVQEPCHTANWGPTEKYVRLHVQKNVILRVADQVPPGH